MEAKELKASFYIKDIHKVCKIQDVNNMFGQKTMLGVVEFNVKIEKRKKRWGEI